MKSTQRILLSLLVLLMISFVLVACSEPTEAPGSDSTTTLDSTTGVIEETPSELPLLADGKFNFTIIRPEFEADSVVSAASHLRNELSNISGDNVVIATDFLPKGETEHDPDSYEILFGHTNYPESEELYKGLNYGAYRIAVKGNKIVIAASDAESASSAALDFADHVKTLLNNAENAAIAPDYTAEKACNPITSKVPVYSYGKFETTYTGAHKDTAYVYKSTSPEDFNSYVTASTTEGGCTLYTSAEMGDNLSATLTNGKAIVNVFYTAAEKKVRLIIESSDNTSLPIREADRSTEKVCDSVLYQLGLEYPYDGGELFTSKIAGFQIGMCYIFRLHDGTFIVIDGGFNRDKGAGMIYDKLKELAPDKNNIVVSAWIMSHQHGDHVGAFRKLAETYSSKLTIKHIIYNFPTTTELSGVGESTGSSSSTIASAQKFKSIMPITAHPGQVHYISNAKIEVLHTLDLMRPRTSFVGGNSFCIAIKLTIEGQTFLFPGDSHTDMTALLLKNYGSYLKSDFIQVIHHGAPGGSNEFYQAVDPTVALWPLGAWDYYPWRRYESYHQFLFTSKNVKEIVLAGSTDRKFDLPYTFPTEKVLPPEIEVTWDYTQGK